jgi:M6 family metalloprotease-like protein
MMKRPGMTIVLILMLIAGTWVQASIPPHPRVRQLMKEGRIAEPYYLQNLDELRSRGLNAPWADEDLRFQRAQALRPPARSHGPALVPTGAYNALVILVDFSDDTAQVAAAEFDTLIFADTPGTMRDYFNTVSYGNLDVVCVNLPGTLGWTRADSAYSYYTTDEFGVGHNGTGAYPRNVQKLVEETVHALDATIDYTQYDNDADGYVDALFVVHAGPGAEYTGSDYDIWSHAWVTSSEQLMDDGALIWRYSTEPEYWTNPGDMTIGVYAHEMGHAVFGVPDLYDRDYSSEGLGDWSLMAGGSWNGFRGDSPAFPDAWTAIQMGYVTATNVVANAVDQAIAATETTPTAFRLWTDGALGDEYFLVENRQQVSYDAALPGEGLLIYHVDETALNQNDDEWYPGYTAYGNYLVALEQADGLWELEQVYSYGDSGDPYPGITGNTAFDFSSVPSSHDYAGNDTYVAIRNISSSGPTMTADFFLSQVIAVSPESLSVDLVTDQTADQVITIENTGEFTFAFNISSQSRSAAAGSPLHSNVFNQSVGVLSDEGSGKVTDGGKLPVWEANGIEEATYQMLSAQRFVGEAKTLEIMDHFQYSQADQIQYTSAGDDMIEDFEVGTWPWAPWIMAGGGGGYTTSACVYEGAQGIYDGGYASMLDWHYRTDVTVGAPGGVLSMWVKPDNSSDGRYYLGFGADETGGWSLVAAPNTSELLIQQNSGYSYLDLATVAQSWTAGTWYKLEVLFGDEGQVTGNLYAPDGITILNSVSTVIAGFQPAGISIRSFDGWCGDSIGGSSRVPWLSAVPDSGSVPPGGFLDITVTFDAAGMFSGNYEADLLITGTDTVWQQANIPVHMHVTGIPDIAVEPDTLDFGTRFVGMQQDSLGFFLGNQGTDSLVVSGLTILPDDGVFTIDITAPIILYPGEGVDLAVHFAPVSAGLVTATLSIASNDPDENPVDIHLSGTGILPPAIAVLPEMLYTKVEKGDSTVLTFTIDNSAGSGELEWLAAVADELFEPIIVETSPVFTGSSFTVAKDQEAGITPRPSSAGLYTGEGIHADRLLLNPAEHGAAAPLDSILARLNRNYTDITSRIPHRFDFYDGVSGDYISDGGNDMYDGGNYLFTDLGGPIPYSDDWVTTQAAVGDSGKYFTRKHPGLFVFAADLDEVDYFEISGNLGADGDGSTDGFMADFVIEDVWYTVFIKRVFHSWDPSVNHMVIVENASGANHEFATGTDNDYHRITGISNAKRIYYLLYAGYEDYAMDNASVFIDDKATGIIMSAFLEAVGLAPPWMTLEPNSGIVAAGSSVDVDVKLFAIRPPGVYDEEIVILSNDPVNPFVMLPLTVEIPLLTAPTVVSVMDVPGDQGGWVDVSWLPSLDDRETSQSPVLFYSIWQKAPLGEAVSSFTVGLPDGFESASVTLSAPGWMGLGSVGATQDSIYSFLAHTLVDSNQEGTNLSYFRVSAHTALAPSEFVYSEVASGYSVDNIAPGVPSGLAVTSAANGVRVTWEYDMEAEKDFQYFAVYRGQTDTFTPEHPDSTFGITAETFFIDEDMTPLVVNYYRVGAVDHNGNTSELSEAISGDYLSVDGSAGVPETFALQQNYPNPFNPTTVIRFDVPEATYLSLVVYDILGREVAHLEDGYIEPGYHQSVWNGRTSAGREVPTGVYIARLVTPSYRQQIKMVLMK